MATVIPSQISIDDNGVAWIEGTTTKVIEVALMKATSGLSPEELQSELPHLSLAQVYAALAHYHAHKDQLDAEIERRRAYAEQMAVQAGTSLFAERLRKLGKLP